MPLRNEDSPRHLSSFHLEALRLGVASDDERAWAESHRAGCPRCQELVADLDGYRNEFVRTAMPGTRAAVRERLSRGPRFRRWVAGLLAPLAVAAVILVMRHPATVTDDDVLEKGGPQLHIAARRGERVFPVRSGEQVLPGDQIRFLLKGVKFPYGLIASVDGAGKPNIYVPYEGGASAPLTPAEQQEMAGSIVLDSRLGPERVFALFSRTPLSADEVRRALAAIGGKGPAAIRNASALPVPADAQASVLLEKVAP
jgi:hypothetical protein